MAHLVPPWDVNKYKNEFESEEHWELRKKFMLTHMDKFTEERLVCLSKVFFNMEFLGCRYPEKTMKLVEELSKGVADEHREKQKGKLKRTFVKASDAAEAKIKGQGVQPPIEPPGKLSRGGIGFCPSHVNLAKPPPQPVFSGDFPGLILFENCNKFGYVQTCPITILMNTIQKNKKWNVITFSKNRVCEIKINDKLLTSAEGATVKEAKLNAAIKGLDILRQTCYTIQVKRNYVSDGSITKDNNGNESDNPLPQDNIGYRIMQKMGWSGSGLGKSQQGIQDPIKAAPQIMRKSGFGSVNSRELEIKFRKCFKDYTKSDRSNDLVFSPDFSAEERKILHRNESHDQEECDDLFGSYSEEYLIADIEDSEEIPEPPLPELSEGDLCFVCRKLEFITGEESDDEIYVSVWYRPTDDICDMDILQPSEHNCARFRETITDSRDLLEIQPMDVSPASAGNSDPFEQHTATGERKGPLTLEKQTGEVSSALLDDKMCLSQDWQEKEPTVEKIKIFLPDGSYKRIMLDEVLASEGLKKFTKYSDEIAMVYKHFTTVDDLKTNAALRELFSDFLLPYKNPQTEVNVLEDNIKTSCVKETNSMLTNNASSTQVFGNTAHTIENPPQNSISEEYTMLQNNSSEYQFHQNTEPADDDNKIDNPNSNLETTLSNTNLRADDTNNPVLENQLTDFGRTNTADCASSPVKVITESEENNPADHCDNNYNSMTNQPVTEVECMNKSCEREHTDLDSQSTHTSQLDSSSDNTDIINEESDCSPLTKITQKKIRGFRKKKIRFFFPGGFFARFYENDILKFITLQDIAKTPNKRIISAEELKTNIPLRNFLSKHTTPSQFSQILQSAEGVEDSNTEVCSSGIQCLELENNRSNSLSSLVDEVKDTKEQMKMRFQQFLKLHESSEKKGPICLGQSSSKKGSQNENLAIHSEESLDLLKSSGSEETQLMDVIPDMSENNSILSSSAIN